MVTKTAPLDVYYDESQLPVKPHMNDPLVKRVLRRIRAVRGVETEEGAEARESNDDDTPEGEQMQNNVGQEIGDQDEIQ